MHLKLESEIPITSESTINPASSGWFADESFEVLEPATRKPVVVVLPIEGSEPPDPSALSVLLSLTRWAKDRSFYRPIQFVLRDATVPSAEESNAESVVMLGDLGHYTVQGRSEVEASFLPSWFSRKGDYIAFLSNERARQLAGVAIGLFSSACSLNVAFIKTTLPEIELFPAFKGQLEASVPTFLVTDTSRYRHRAALGRQRLQEIQRGLEQVLSGFAGESPHQAI